MKQVLLTAAAFGLSAVLLTGCGGVTEEMAAARNEGIALLEGGDYEGAIREFESLLGETKRVSEFEIDVLKYRAEAEFKLEDYGAAAYTYKILSQVDRERPEYMYFSALALAKADDIGGARECFDSGVMLDEKETEKSAGYAEAALALGDAFLRAGNSGEAEALYQELWDSGQATTEVCSRLMTAAMERGEYETALTLAAGGFALPDGTKDRELRFNEAVCYEYLSRYDEALSRFRAYLEEFGSDEKAEHEIAFLVTR